MEGRKKQLVKDLNAVLTCRLCEGYFVDATTLVECLHTFCRGCILRYFENSKTQCPMCSMVYKKKSQCFRSDTQIQALVYKLVPSLFVKEIQRREDFYRSTGVRAGSSCSDDSVIDRERDMMHETEEMISQCVGDKTQYFSPEDSISLSLEYYQPHLDTTDITSDKKVTENKDIVPEQTNINNENTYTDTTSKNSVDNSSDVKEKSDSDQENIKNNGQISTDNANNKVKRDCVKRYLQCPAGVNMKHLQKFVRMKYGLAADHRVDIIHKGEVLPSDFSLMDVAYTFKWEKKNPMRFFYRIFKPMKIRPIKIVNTTLSTGGKQLQIVPVNNSSHSTNTTHTPESPTNANTIKSPKSPKVEKIPEKKEAPLPREETESEQQDKETLLAHLQLQSKSKALQNAEAKRAPVPEKIVKECVFEYEEPDQEEIKRFAERRDREWALQKKLEEEIRTEQDKYYSREHYSSKKRKKSKHSKNESNGHKEKKRKLHVDKIHAEITNNDKTDLKLKVKITTNGHKHKHHKIENSDKSDISHKEKLLQMRQVRHKHVSGSSGDEKSQPAIPIIKVSKAFITERPKDTNKYFSGDIETKRKSPKPSEVSGHSDNNNKPVESQSKPRIEPVVIKSMPNMIDPSNGRHNAGISRTLSRPEFPAAKVVKTDANTRVPTMNLERQEQKDRNAQKTFLKTTPANSDRYTKDQKISQSKMENTKASGQMSNAKVLPIGSITTNNKSLDRKIASLQQRCTIEPKNLNNIRTDGNKTEKKVSFNGDKSKVATPQYPPGFTVSKIDSNVKRKAEDNDTHEDKRPSLEITLIPTTTNNTSIKPTEAKHVAKRPPPGTIPLERIKNAVNLKSGISIIPKMPERTDNIGVLDLSKPNKTPENSPRSSPKNEPINGLSSMVNRQINNTIPRPANSPNRSTPENKNVQLSNLKMLSTVALEHQTINKNIPNNIKSRPQMPSLQSINRMPSMQQTHNSIRGPGMHRLPPKLNEIQKFRPSNPQIRNLRPNQNQNIRNIPNPSLLMNRQQQIQNKLVSNPNLASDKREAASNTSTPVTSTTGPVSKEMSSIKSAILEQNLSEKKEISV